jgi:hypothetical protein
LPTNTQNVAKTAMGAFHVDRDLVLQFFVIFARFEYAAKANGLVEKTEGKVIDLKLSQSAIGKRVEAALFERAKGDKALAEAIDYYRAWPPRKQVWDGTKGNFRWDDGKPNEKEGEATKLLVSLSRVRNNLFHGGKGFEPESKALERDTNLLSYGIALMQAVLGCDEEMQTSFNTYLPKEAATAN